MGTDETPRWRDVRAEIWNIVADDVASEEIDPTDDDACDTYAHEWADGSADVIYSYRSRALWADPDSPDFDDEANELCAPDADIQQRITTAVYCMIRAEIREALQDAAEREEARQAELDEAESLPA